MAYNPTLPAGQATMANSNPVVLASNQSAIAVTGTFFQGTQPISGNVGVTGSVAVTGTFFQATQPVSITTMPSTPVTGTFWQATQPVSGTVGVSGSVAVTGTFWQATQPISGTVTVTGVATAANQATEIASLANLDVALSTRLKPADTLAAVTTLGTITNVVHIDDNAGSITVDGTVTANAGTNLNTSLLALESGGNLAILAARTPALGQTTIAGASSVVTASDEIGLTVTGQSAQTATVNNILTTTAGAAATTVTGYRSFSVQVNSTATGGAYIFEGSNDNVNFVGIPIFNLGTTLPSPNTAAITPTAANIIWGGSINFTYLRLRISTTITGGSVQAFLYLSRNPFTPSVVPVAQPTAASLNTTAVIASGTVTTVSTVTTLTQALASAAAADGKANPTMSAWQSIPFLFNGTTWDRIHGNWNTTTGDTGAKVAAGNGATQTNFDSRGATITLLLGTVSGTFTTFQLQLQWSPDAGTTWINYGPATANTTTPASGNTFGFQIYPTNQSLTPGATPTSMTTGATQTVFINGILPRTWRVTWNIAGSTPSAAFTAVYVNYNL